MCGKMWNLPILCIIFAFTSAQNSPRNYFKSCLTTQKPNGLTHPLRPSSAVNSADRKKSCTTYQCLMKSEILDLRQLSGFNCNSDYQCANDISGMVCSNHSVNLAKICSCPYGYAYSTVECRCKPAELCWSDKVSY